MARTLPLVCLLLLATACGDSGKTPVRRPAYKPLRERPACACEPIRHCLRIHAHGSAAVAQRTARYFGRDQAWPPQLTSNAEGRYGIFKGPFRAKGAR